MLLSRSRLALALTLCAASASIAIAQDAGARQDAGVPADAAIPTDAAAPDPVAPAAEAPADDPELPPGVGPIEWAPALGRDCHRYAKRRVCEGPRRVPMASPEALERQRALGLDQPRVAHRATSGPVPPEWAAAAPPGAPDDGLLWPVQGGRMWRGFGMHRRLQRTKSGRLRQLRGRRRHEGIDIGAPEGTPILAADDALVVYSDNGMGGYGNALLLVHHDGAVTMYAHCRETYVAAGELVRRGQIIAAVGDTGLAHGAHLHFEWRVGGQVRDPARHLVGRPGSAPADAEPTGDGEPPADAEVPAAPDAPIGSAGPRAAGEIAAAEVP